MKNDNIEYVIGEGIKSIQPMEPYSELICDFMDDVSKKLRSNKKSIKYPDIISLAFWCRKANILRLKEEFHTKYPKMGRGLVFHVTPSNVPVNFAFSFFFGLLSGNGNIVRIPNRKFEQIPIICDAIRFVLNQEKYKQIKDMTAFISYPRDDEITAYYSSICDARIIWGGDDTINHIRQFPIRERTIEVVFSDRYSICIMNSNAVQSMGKEELKNLAEKFYNDTYLMDQNACSTPHLLLWYGGNDDEKEYAKRIFWDMVHSISQKYDLPPIKSMDKYTLLCHTCMDRDDIKNVKQYDNFLYTIEMDSLPADICELRGKFGLFYQININELNEIIPCISPKIQTLTYAGMDKSELASFVLKNHLNGIDRIVPVGASLEIGVYWDGYDIINCLSRCIECR